ncbi:hypothetical protein TWF696_007331 [Orbilia brochopaga]|uniref:Uncharacterized protein n=1 Tax=Orbilia brochopaga TaxID=3140254 RepID=A0AAV9UT30_9PEZI
MAAMNITQARKIALAQFLKAAAGLASDFETGKTAATTILEWLTRDQDELLDELVGLLPKGDVEGLEDPVVKVLDIVRSIIPASDISTPVQEAREAADDELVATTASHSSAPQASTRWADYDDDEEEYVPEILRSTAEQPAVVMAGGRAGDEPAVATAQDPALPADGRWMEGRNTSCGPLELAVEKVPELAVAMAHGDLAGCEPAVVVAPESAPLGVSRCLSRLGHRDEEDEDEYDDEDDGDDGMGVEEGDEQSRFPPYMHSNDSQLSLGSSYPEAERHPYASEIQDPGFRGYWIDECGNRRCYVGDGEYLVDEHGEYVKEGYYWDRHPFTPPMSVYERMTLANDAEAVGTPGELRCKRAGNKMFKPNIKAIGERMRAKIALAGKDSQLASVGVVDIPSIATTSTTEVAAGAVDVKQEQSAEKPEEQPSNEVEAGAILMTPPPEASGSSDSNGASSASLEATTPPTTATPTPPMTPLEFLISRGLYRDKLGTGPPLPPPPAKRKGVWGRRHAWAAKVRGEVKSLRATVGNTLVDKLTIRAGAW